MTWRLLRTWSDPEMQRKAVWTAAMMNQCRAQGEALGVSTEAVVGQAADESGWGAHCIGQHNLYGIKVGVGWTGMRVNAMTFEYEGDPPTRISVMDWFRDYPSFGDSIDDHLAFLKQNTRYAAAGVFDRKGDEAYFLALKAAGYATAPNYAEALLAVRDTIRQYFLSYMTDDDAAPLVGVIVAPVPPSSRWLMIGNHGGDVLELQRKLGFAGDDLDGWFGAETRSAIMAFQAAHPPLDVDGVVGNKTRTALGL